MANSTGSTPLHKVPRSWAGSVAIDDSDIKAGGLTGSSLSTAINTKTETRALATIATTGAQEVLFLAPQAGTLTGAWITAKDALATSDSNYVTFSCINKGQAGAGTTELLSATASGTTKATGGAAIAAYTKRSLPLHATNSKVVAKGDTLAFTVTATGTLANTVTEAVVELDFQVTT